MQTLIQIDRDAPVPLHDQIKEQILGLIHAGRLKAGDQLPTMRALSIELAVNFNTVALAYRELDSQGVIATRRGEGTFVRDTPAEPEMAQIRQGKLNSLVKRMLDEAGRLGYSVDEVKQTVGEQISQAVDTMNLGDMTGMAALANTTQTADVTGTEPAETKAE